MRQSIEEKRAVNRAWHAAHRDEIAAKDRAYYEANQERIRARERERYAATGRARRAANPAMYSLRARGVKYGLTPEELRSLFESQGSRCAICRTPLPLTGPGAAHVDHDHDTSEVRGFLCGHCNRMLGLAQDSPLRLRAAAAYLDRRQPSLRLKP